MKPYQKAIYGRRLISERFRDSNEMSMYLIIKNLLSITIDKTQNFQYAQQEFQMQNIEN